jgi:uncharacterized protein (TIGR03437 family)
MLWTAAAAAQIPSNASLNGRYYFRHVMFTLDATGAITQAQSMAGTLTFNGAGGFTYSGAQTIGATGTGTPSGSGTYAVRPSGLMTLTNPQRPELMINARLGALALVGSTTEAGNTLFDLLVAIPAPAAAVSNATLNGSYQVATFEVPAANLAQIRATAFSATANGAGSLGDPLVAGHAANVSAAVISQRLTAANYTVNADGTGSATFPLATGASAATQLLSGTRSIYVSGDGSLILGGSTAAGGHDILFAVKSLSAATNASLSGLFFTAGLTIGSGVTSAFAGSANSPGLGSILASTRYHEAPGPTLLDVTTVNRYSLGPSGSGTVDVQVIAVGAGGGALFAAGVSDLAPNDYGLSVGIRAVPASGTGVFVNPQGIVNAASLAPVGAPIAPGEYISVFGSGLASQTQGATSLPLPLTLGGVQVMVNGKAAPLNYVSATQINLQVPFSTSGATATIAIGSSSADVPLAPTAPGVFSQSSSGTGLGAILHANFTPVTAASPATRGETVLIFLTGLGAVSGNVTEGTAAPSNPLSLVAADVTVLINRQPAAVVFKGLAPGFAGLYQLNVTIPANATTGNNVALAIATAQAFHDQVEIAIR